MAYDEVTVMVPPDGVYATGWQTKGLECDYSQFRIDADGAMFDMSSKVDHRPYEPRHGFDMIHSRGTHGLRAHVEAGRVVRLERLS